MSTDKPDLVLTNGVVEFEGSGGDRYYVFKNGKYTYQCYIIVMGSYDSPPAELSVFKNDKEILNQPATKLEGK